MPPQSWEGLLCMEAALGGWRGGSTPRCAPPTRRSLTSWGLSFHIHKVRNNNSTCRGGGEGRGRDKSEDWALLYIKYVTNGDLLYSTGNSSPYSVMTYMGKKSKKERLYVYVELIHSAVQQKITQHCKSTLLQ